MPIFKKLFNFIVFSLLTVQANSTTVLIWEPHEPKNPYGHAAINTAAYHMSLWPDNSVEGIYDKLQTFATGTPGALIYHQDYDRFLENNRNPLEYHLDDISPRRINSVYEEVLDYNDITPDTVTIEAGNELVKKKKRPAISLSKGRYSYIGWGEPLSNPGEEGLDVLVIASVAKDFYKHNQSCTTFCTSLILNSCENKHRFFSPILKVPEFKEKVERKFEKKDCIIS